MGYFKNLEIEKMEGCNDCGVSLEKALVSCIRCGTGIQKCDDCQETPMCDYCNHVGNKMTDE